MDTATILALDLGKYKSVACAYRGDARRRAALERERRIAPRASADSIQL